MARRRPPFWARFVVTSAVCGALAWGLLPPLPPNGLVDWTLLAMAAEVVLFGAWWLFELWPINIILDNVYETRGRR